MLLTKLNSSVSLSVSRASNNYKWKNHFSEMKGDVGMLHHEKEGNKKMPIPRQEIIDNPIPTSLFMYILCSCSVVFRYWGCNFRTYRNTCKCVQIIVLGTKM